MFDDDLDVILGVSQRRLNVYEQVVIVSKRARQIVEQRREEFCEALERIGIPKMGREQVINTEGWQETLAKAFEAKENPVTCAVRELEEGALSYTYLSEGIF